MAHRIFRTVLTIMFSLPLVAISYTEAPAQERATCSQARSWKAASLPKTVRRLYRNWLLDCGAYKKMRIREAISRCGQTAAAPI
jgi:hypothetical protein